MTPADRIAAALKTTEGKRCVTLRREDVVAMERAAWTETERRAWHSEWWKAVGCWHMWRRISIAAFALTPIAAFGGWLVGHG